MNACKYLDWKSRPGLFERSGPLPSLAFRFCWAETFRITHPKNKFVNLSSCLSLRCDLLSKINSNIMLALWRFYPLHSIWKIQYSNLALITSERFEVKALGDEENQDSDRCRERAARVLTQNKNSLEFNDERLQVLGLELSPGFLKTLGHSSVFWVSFLLRRSISYFVVDSYPNRRNEDNVLLPRVYKVQAEVGGCWCQVCANSTATREYIQSRAKCGQRNDFRLQVNME